MNNVGGRSGNSHFGEHSVYGTLFFLNDKMQIEYDFTWTKLFELTDHVTYRQALDGYGPLKDDDLRF